MTNSIHKRGRYSTELKQKVATEAIAGNKSIAQIASEYGVSPDAVKDWKKQALTAMAESFGRRGPKTEMARKDARITSLERLLKQREFELDWRSKKAKELGL